MTFDPKPINCKKSICDLHQTMELSTVKGQAVLCA
jgi:hypothetical protein